MGELGDIELECEVTASQQHILSHSRFVRDDDDDNFSDDNDKWPEFSSDELPDGDLTDAVKITFCSPPPSPANGPDDAGDGGAVDLGFPGEIKRGREEEESEIAELDGGDTAVVEKGGVFSAREFELNEDDRDDVAVTGTPVKRVELVGGGVVVDDDKRGAAAESGGAAEAVLEGGVIGTEELSSDEDAEDDVAETEELYIGDSDGDGVVAGEAVDGASSKVTPECFQEMLRVVMESQFGKKSGGGDGNADIFETAKRRGMTFPQPRLRRFD